MSSYKAPIGRSSYEIPYTSQEDLLLLREICFEANKIVNSILASSNDITNEFALALALINLIYENHSLSKTTQISNTSQNQQNKTTYTTEDVLTVITHLQKKLLEIEHVS